MTMFISIVLFLPSVMGLAIIGLIGLIHERRARMERTVVVRISLRYSHKRKITYKLDDRADKHDMARMVSVLESAVQQLENDEPHES